MAPEILRGETFEEAADVYSFGIMLWELMTGNIPYMGRSVAQITGMVGHFGETLKAPPKSNKYLRKILNNCLLFDSEKRPTFEHIAAYIDKTLDRPRSMSHKSPYVSYLQDYIS